MEMIKADINDDVMEMEHSPFDGRHVATFLGNLAAQVSTLAEVIRRMAGDDLRLRHLIADSMKPQVPDADA